LPDQSLIRSGADRVCEGRPKREEWGRLVKQPLKAQGHVMLDICSPDGAMRRQVVSRGKWKGAPGVFVAARKSQLGGLWPHLVEEGGIVGK
ncbi:unnamed protein product, partial [Discosporangium mesarthrocarpum]